MQKSVNHQWQTKLRMQYFPGGSFRKASDGRKWIPLFVRLPQTLELIRVSLSKHAFA